MHIDPILIEEPISKDEWLIETEKPCLMDDLVWLDEARKNNDNRDFLDVTALSNEITSIVIDNESKEKRQRVDSFSSVNKGKGSIVDDADETGDDID